MEEDTLGRRSVLRNAGLAAGGAVLGGVALASPASATGRHDHDELAGSWRVDVHNDNGDETDSIISFAGGDVCVVHDISPAGPPFTGSWRAGRHDSFRATVLTGTPGEDGPGSPGAVIELKLRGAVRHGTIRGSFTYRATDPGGNVLETGSGTFDGTRVQA
jgi:hypothetical protein